MEEELVQLLTLIAIVIFIAFLGFLFFLKWRQTKKFQAQVYHLPTPPEKTGVLAENNLLTQSEKILRGKLDGPESVLVEEGTLYTGTADGRVIKIVDGKVEKYINLRDDFGTRGKFETEPHFGRPLGIRRLNADCLVVADAYNGVFKVDLNRGLVTQIFCSHTDVCGVKCGYVNDLDVLDEKVIYLTDSSINFQRRQFTNVMLENAPSGRIIEIKIWSGESRVLLDGLFYPFGIQIHPDRQSLVYAEAVKCRIMRYYFTGPKEGQLEAFASNLPGVPNNIRLSADGKSFLCGMHVARFEGKPAPVDLLSPHPKARRLLVTMIPDEILGRMSKMVLPRYGLVVQLDLEGNIVRSYHDPEGKIKFITHASDDENYLYLGSMHNKYIARVPKIV
ncbi:unnamed protein product [Bursaphelenchus okinawaensis]|uniref:Strictosidine synthase conserved region domain-containing protein n=1 Tax=Bursaphelenchus okinawaensis TaxID=465554 RepID=A0A811K979_9BILA|nr:unnamed protein product [Bursaphelenchus okinawaensis]CAG9097361.1 unnamed protein product [Bursaphelenchus okinawaensis]